MTILMYHHEIKKSSRSYLGIVCYTENGMDIFSIIFSIIILIISIMFHELAHGTMADRLGDMTARNAGRLTLNPLKHLEWVGSFFIPLLCIILGSGFVIGWAKPVPFQPHNLRNKRFGPALVALAGPLMNILIAIIVAVIIRIWGITLDSSFVSMLASVVIINVSLAVFNLIPFPPLDGYHILGALVPRFRVWAESFMMRFGMIALIIVLFIGSSFIAPIVRFFVNVLLIW